MSKYTSTLLVLCVVFTAASCAGQVSTKRSSITIQLMPVSRSKQRSIKRENSAVLIHASQGHGEENEVLRHQKPLLNSGRGWNGPYDIKGAFGRGSVVGSSRGHAGNGAYDDRRTSCGNSIDGGSGNHINNEVPGAGRHSGGNNAYGNADRHGGNEIPGGRGPSEVKDAHGCSRQPENNEIYSGSEHHGRTAGGKGGHESNGQYGSKGADGDTVTEDVGCDDGSNGVVSVGKTFRKGNFVTLCKKVNSTAVMLVPVNCILDEQVMQVGQEKRSGGFGFACRKTEDGITLDVIGCFGDQGAFAVFGKTFSVGSFIYKCVKTGDVAMHDAYGCTIRGEQVKLNQTVPVNGYAYKCYVSEGVIRSEAVACLDESGRKHRVGELYPDRSFLYKCERKGATIMALLAGCLANVTGSVEMFKFGEKWDSNPNGLLSYKMRCVGNESLAMTDITHCIAHLDGTHFSAAVGDAIALPEKRILLCCKQADGTILGKIACRGEFEGNGAKSNVCGSPSAKPSPVYQRC